MPPRRQSHGTRTSVFSSERRAATAKKTPQTAPAAPPRKILTGERFQQAARQRNRGTNRRVVIAATLAGIFILIMLERLLR